MAKSDNPFIQIADQAVAEAERLEKANQLLQAQLDNLKKKAASQQEVNQTIQKLCKSGCLCQSQKEQAKQLLMTDANAALRVIKSFCDCTANAQSLNKKASSDLYCGQLTTQHKQTNQNNVGDAWEAVRRVFASH